MATTHMMMRRWAIAVLGASVLAAAPSLRAQEPLGIAIGAKAPGAKVETLAGRPANLDTYVGHGPVLLEFWATWCPNCRELEPRLEAAIRRYGKRIHFVGVAVSVNESPALVARYVAAHHRDDAIVFDRHGAAVAAYSVPATSYVVVIDGAGKIVYTGLGGNQDLNAAIAKAM